MNADGTDNWAFVATTDIPGGEMISFTDNGWKADNTFRTGEGIITWTAPEEGVACGTVVTIDYNALASVGSASESGSLDFQFFRRSAPGLPGQYRSSGFPGRTE